MSQTPAELHAILQNLHIYEQEPITSAHEIMVHKRMFELLAELLMPDDSDVAFVAIADYIIKTPASHKLLQEYGYIADYLRRQIDENIASTRLLDISGELSTVLARI